MSRHSSLPLGALAAALLVACGGPAAPPPVAARSFDDPGFVASGSHELRYGMLPSAELSAGVAAAYGIDRDVDQLIVNLSVLERRPGRLPLPVEAEVSGTWRSLVGEPAALQFRMVRAGGAVSYVAAAPLGDREPIVLELRALPPGSAQPLTARITRQFDLR